MGSDSSGSPTGLSLSPLTLAIHLLGRPHAERRGAPAYRFRSRKSWALLAYLRLAERPPSRSQVAGLLFDSAEDPLRTLRWTLSEIRQCLGPDGTVDGDPLRLDLAPGVVFDVDVLIRGSWRDATEVPGLGQPLLEGITIPSAAAFEVWLLSAQRRLAATSEAILHEAAMGHLSEGALDVARDLAVRAVTINPLGELHQALLIRLYRLEGADEAAQRQFAAYTALLKQELGVSPGAAAFAALNEPRPPPPGPTDRESITAIIESGDAAVHAGVVEQGLGSLRTAVQLADLSRVRSLRIQSRLSVAEALIHSLRGRDEEGVAALHEADRIAVAIGDQDAVAQVRAELGYVDFLRANYDRAEVWLTDALHCARRSPTLTAKATIYLGAVASDRGAYPRAIELLERGVRLARDRADPKRVAYGLTMSGRVHLLRGDLDLAAQQLREAAQLAEDDHWLAFLPWPQAFLGEVQLLDGDLDAAERTLRQAFARACQIGDPCWEGASARGLALVAEAGGDAARAFDVLADAQVRTTRFSDPYVWLEAYILAAQCDLGRRHGHPETARWIETLRSLASRTAMRELTVRAMLHAAALGSDSDAQAAALMGAGLDHPRLQLEIAALESRAQRPSASAAAAAAQLVDDGVEHGRQPGRDLDDPAAHRR